MQNEKKYVHRQNGEKKPFGKNPLEKQTFEKISKKCFQKETTTWEKYNPFEKILLKKKTPLEKIAKRKQKVTETKKISTTFRKENTHQTNPFEKILVKKNSEKKKKL